MKSVSKHSLRGKKILITGGPTWVPIDEMRVISNRSTGRLSQTLAVALANEGAKVTFLEGPVAERLKEKKVNVIPFVFFDELSEALRKETAKGYDAVIHAAAVSDFRLKTPFKEKIDSSIKRLSLELIPTDKLITKIKKWSRRTFLVGFKLECTMNVECAVIKTRELFQKAHCDLVVANSLKAGRYEAFLIDPDKNVLAFASTRESLAAALVEILKVKL